MFLLLLTLFASQKPLRDTTFITVPTTGDTIWITGDKIWSSKDTVYIDDILHANKAVIDSIIGYLIGKSDSSVICDYARTLEVGNPQAFSIFSSSVLERYDLFDVTPNQACQGIAYYGDYIYTCTHIDSAGGWRKAIYKWGRTGTLIDSFIQDDFPGVDAVKEFGDMNVIFGKLYVAMNNYGGTAKNFVKIFDLDLNTIDSSPLLTRQKVLEGVDWYDNYFWTCDGTIDTVFKYDMNWDLIKAYPLTAITGHGYQGMSWNGKSLFINVHEGSTPLKLFEYQYNKTLDSLIEIKQWTQPGSVYTQGIDFIDKNTIIFSGRAFTPARDTVLFCDFKRSLGYTLSLQVPDCNPQDDAIYYFGNIPYGPTTLTNIRKIYIRKDGTIKMAECYTYARNVAGTNEPWSFYVRKNGTTDYLVQTVSISNNERIFSNTSINIPVVSGDYIEMKIVDPTWVTNPTNVTVGGYLYIE